MRPINLVKNTPLLLIPAPHRQNSFRSKTLEYFDRHCGQSADCFSKKLLTATVNNDKFLSKPPSLHRLIQLEQNNVDHIPCYNSFVLNKNSRWQQQRVGGFCFKSLEPEQPVAVTCSYYGTH
jgi:hypothetical protein